MLNEKRTTILRFSLRLNIPVIFVSGGPMEAGKTKLSDQIIKLDLVDAMIQLASSVPLYFLLLITPSHVSSSKGIWGRI